MDLSGGGPTWGHWYWPIQLAFAFLTFLGPEVYALAGGKPANTLSAFVWRTLQITRNENIGSWSALDYLTFGIWIVVFTWLTFHFFFGRFT